MYKAKCLEEYLEDLRVFNQDKKPRLENIDILDSRKITAF